MRWGLSSALALAMVLASNPAMASEVPALHALIVGIERYEKEPLEGAVADARGLAQLAQELGSKKTVVLLNEQASRQSIFDAWDELLDGSKPGDTLWISYSGHGSQLPGKANDESDQLNEAMVLSDVKSDPELIVDDEWGARLAQAQDRYVLFVADACHSSTMTRAPPSPFRSASRGIELPADIRYSGIRFDEPQDHVLRFSAASDAATVREIQVDGQIRGALSVAFERAVRGLADRDNGDGLINGSELQAAIAGEFRFLTDGVEAPIQVPDGLRDRVFLRSLGTLEDVEISPGRVAVVNPDEAFARFNAVHKSVPKREADFLWDQAAGVLYRLREGEGKIVLDNIRSAREITGEVLRWQIRDLLANVQNGDLRIRVNDSNGQPMLRGINGEGAEWLVDGGNLTEWTVLNLSSRGALFVLAEGDAQNRGVFTVGEPFGIEHLMLIAWPKKVEHHFVEQAPATRALTSDDFEYLKSLTMRKDVRIAWHTFYTQSANSTER